MSKLKVLSDLWQLPISGLHHIVTEAFFHGSGLLAEHLPHPCCSALVRGSVRRHSQHGGFPGIGEPPCRRPGRRHCCMGIGRVLSCLAASWETSVHTSCLSGDWLAMPSAVSHTVVIPHPHKPGPGAWPRMSQKWHSVLDEPVIKCSRESPHSGWFAEGRDGAASVGSGHPRSGWESCVASAPHTQQGIGRQTGGGAAWVMMLKDQFLCLLVSKKISEPEFWGK